MSNATVLFPLPLTPVTTTNLSLGIVRSTSRRLCSLAPTISIAFDRSAGGAGSAVDGPWRDTPEIGSLRLVVAHPCAPTVPRGAIDIDPAARDPASGAS